MLGRGLAKPIGRLRRRLSPRSPVILTYHRVFESPHDHWGLNTPPEVFAEQMDALRSVRRVLSLGDLLMWIRNGRASDKPLAAVTFDDGYRDAHDAAWPILERLDMPATVFVVSGLVDTPWQFWWDELAQILLENEHLPGELELSFGQAMPHRWRFPPNDQGARLHACNQIRRRLLNMAPLAIEALMWRIRDWARAKRAPRPSHRVMTSEELARLDRGPVRVGAHTVNHPSLPVLDRASQWAEVSESRRALEAIVGRPVTDFAYPYGHFDEASVMAVRRSDMTSACTIVPGIVSRSSDDLRLPRISLGSVDGDVLLQAIQ